MERHSTKSSVLRPVVGPDSPVGTAWPEHDTRAIHARSSRCGRRAEKAELGQQSPVAPSVNPRLQWHHQRDLHESGSDDNDGIAPRDSGSAKDRRRGADDVQSPSPPLHAEGADAATKGAATATGAAAVTGTAATAAAATPPVRQQTTDGSCASDTQSPAESWNHQPARRSRAIRAHSPPVAGVASSSRRTLPNTANARLDTSVVASRCIDDAAARFRAATASPIAKQAAKLRAAEHVARGDTSPSRQVARESCEVSLCRTAETPDVSRLQPGLRETAPGIGQIGDESSRLPSESDIKYGPPYTHQPWIATCRPALFHSVYDDTAALLEQLRSVARMEFSAPVGEIRALSAVGEWLKFVGQHESYVITAIQKASAVANDASFVGKEAVGNEPRFANCGVVSDAFAAAVTESCVALDNFMRECRLNVINIRTARTKYLVHRSNVQMRLKEDLDRLHQNTVLEASRIQSAMETELANATKSAQEMWDAWAAIVDAFQKSIVSMSCVNPSPDVRVDAEGGSGYSDGALLTSFVQGLKTCVQKTKLTHADVTSAPVRAIAQLNECISTAHKEVLSYVRQTCGPNLLQKESSPNAPAAAATAAASAGAFFVSSSDHSYVHRCADAIAERNKIGVALTAELEHLRRMYAEVKDSVDKKMTIIPQQHYMQALQEAIASKQHAMESNLEALTAMTTQMHQAQTARVVCSVGACETLLQDWMFTCQQLMQGCKAAEAAFATKWSAYQSRRHEIGYMTECRKQELRADALRATVSAKGELMEVVSCSVQKSMAGYAQYKESKQRAQDVVSQRIPTLLTYCAHASPGVATAPSVSKQQTLDIQIATLQQLCKDYFALYSQLRDSHEAVVTCITAVLLSEAVVSAFGVSTASQALHESPSV